MVSFSFLAAQVDGTVDDSSDDTDSSDSDSASGPAAKRAKTNGNAEKPPTTDESSSSSEDEKPEEEDEDDGDEPPLCSDDDLSDMDPELFFPDVENRCVCLYRNVKEEKSKERYKADRDSNWILQLSNGIMNINGVDFVFQTLDGCAKWN
jgi:hypothetical protein